MLAFTESILTSAIYKQGVVLTMDPGSDVEKEEIEADLIKLNPKGEDRHLVFMQMMISSHLCGASGNS